MAHEHPGGDFWIRLHPEPIVLDIGGDVGALVLYTPPELHRREIDVIRVGHGHRVHAAVLHRVVDGRDVFAAVYPELTAATWRTPAGVVTIEGGAVAHVDWTQRC
jgi:hypothetical protein